MEGPGIRTALTARRPRAHDMRAVRHDELALYHAAAAEKKCSCGKRDWHVTHRIQGVAFVVRHVECRHCGEKDQIATRR